MMVQVLLYYLSFWFNFFKVFHYVICVVLFAIHMWVYVFSDWRKVCIFILVVNLRNCRFTSWLFIQTIFVVPTAIDDEISLCSLPFFFLSLPTWCWSVMLSSLTFSFFSVKCAYTCVIWFVSFQCYFTHSATGRQAANLPDFPSSFPPPSACFCLHADSIS